MKTHWNLEFQQVTDDPHNNLTEQSMPSRAKEKPALKLFSTSKQSDLLDTMNKKPKPISTDNHFKQRDANSILSFTMVTETVQITLFDTPQVNSSKLTTNNQGTTIKIDINEWKIYLADKAPPFAVTTKDFLNQK